MFSQLFRLKETGGMDFMSFIPGGFGRKKRSDTTTQTAAASSSAMRPQMMPPMPGAGQVGGNPMAPMNYNAMQGMFDPFAVVPSAFAGQIGAAGMPNQMGPMPAGGAGGQAGYLKFIPATFGGKKREEKLTKAV